MSFKLTILGCNSAIPIPGRNPTSQVLNTDNQAFLIDCGEGTQKELIKNNIKHQMISHIFISHLHGDHYFGLIGLLTTMHLMGRHKEVHIYAHKELKSIIDIQLSTSNTELRYPLFFHSIPINEEKVLFEDNNIIIHSLILEHRIACSGFLFRQKKVDKNIIKKKLIEYNIPINEIIKIKSGSDFQLEDGTIIPNSQLTITSKPLHSYCYCSDTKYVDSNINSIKDVTVLYHETTFMRDLQEKANETGHSTTLDAANMAIKSNVKVLIIGHYSSRYKDLDELLLETKKYFANTYLALDGTTFDFDRI